MIEIKNLTKRFQKVVALNGLNLRIKRATVFGLVGSNGSGKSTLLRTIAGVFEPDGGSVEINGEQTFENINVKNLCYFVSDYPFFFNSSTINSEAWLLRKVYSNWNEARFNQLCQMFPLDPNARIINMSKGMQRQAALILALSTMPDILLLDEIFDGLDPVVRQLVKKLIADDVASRDMTVVIASHNLRELEDICDTVGLLHRGGLVLQNELDKMRLGIFKIQLAFNEIPQGNIFENLNIVKLEQRGNLFNITVRGDESEIHQKLGALEPVFIESLPLTLEEVFISEMEVAGYDINNIL